MIIANRTLSIIDGAFTIIDRVERVDYIKLGERIIDKAIITAAIIYGVATYIITACQLWWEDNGDAVMAGAFKLIINLVDYTHELYLFGTETKRFIVKTFGFITDRLYYSAIA